jgi:agmatinase
MRERVEAEVRGLLRGGAVPFLVGGDHSVALPALRAVAKTHGPVAVIHLDAHLDTSGPETWGEPFHHGTPLRHAIEEGLVLPGQLHQVGLRGPWSGPEDGGLAEEHGAHAVTADELAHRGGAGVGAALRAAIGDRPAYLTLDVDAIDPAFAPGTGTPVPGGLTSREVIALLRALAGVRLVGMDLVEVCPALDHADLTSHLAAHLLFEGLALAALRA